MIIVAEEKGNGLVLLKSDKGLMLDIGCGPVVALVAHRSEIPYIDEVEVPKDEPQEAPVNEEE